MRFEHPKDTKILILGVNYVLNVESGDLAIQINVVIKMYIVKHVQLKIIVIKYNKFAYYVKKKGQVKKMNMENQIYIVLIVLKNKKLIKYKIFVKCVIKFLEHFQMNMVI